MSVVDAKLALATSTPMTSVFERGNLKVKDIKVERSAERKALLIVSPTEQGKYPVFVFIHGCCVSNTAYSQLLQHVASHGFIAVAPGDPLVSSLLCCFGNQELKSDANVLEWLPDGLPTVLPDNVIADTTKIAVGGHSRGGKVAFALAISNTNLKISAVFGVDPVAGGSTDARPDPKIFSYIPRCLDLNVPVAIIGTGLGSQAKCLMPPFAPCGVNHAEFFNESKPPIYYFLAKDYGHGDMLDDGIEYWFTKLLTKHGKGSKEFMIKACGGIIVAFLNAKLKGEGEDLNIIGEQPNIAPIKLDPVLYVEN
ncbi:Chlorophyllase [Heracleum sosnowskyi]|uniref:Chlorophyllase n=1 Tax=Heracleum sosnowskyi TaxID=360622 RepID=A0AAD8GZU9_9APIA|nr:Chlorophyllase [Heracleum sosnowskyi]